MLLILSLESGLLMTRTNAKDGTSLSNPTLYQQLVGILIYFTVAQPDIAYVVHFVSQYLNVSLMPHFIKLLKFYNIRVSQSYRVSLSKEGDRNNDPATKNENV